MAQEAVVRVQDGGSGDQSGSSGHIGVIIVIKHVKYHV